MSYSKRMMQIAAEWIATNPDPANPLLRIPRSLQHRSRVLAESNHITAKIAAFERDPRVDRTQLSQLKEQIAKIEEIENQIGGSYQALEDVINRPWDDQQGKICETHQASDVLGRWLVKWARSGHNTFDLSTDFTAAMLLTDHRDLTIDQLELPFPALLITIPDNFAKGPEGGHYTKIHVVATKRRETKELSAATQIVQATQHLSPTDRERVLADAMRGVQVSLAPGLSVRRTGEDDVAITIDSKLVSSASDDDNCLFIYASDGARGLYTAVDLPGLTWDKLEELPAEATDVAEADLEVQRTIWRIVFGTIAYVTAVDKAIEPRLAAPLHKGKKGDDKPRVKHWDVGRTIKIAPELVRAARSGAREVALRVKHRFIVRGHYRNQAHGTGRSLRTRIWITPHWKGPEGGAELVHTYRPEGGTS